MAGKSLRSIISLSRKAAENVRQQLQELSRTLSPVWPPGAQPVPQVARIPVPRQNPWNQTRNFASHAPRNSQFPKQKFQQKFQQKSLHPNFMPSGANASLAAFTQSCSAFRTILRPKLIGGTLPRNAYGYSVGGSSRLFSTHSSSAHQIIQNMSMNLRAFLYSSDDLLKKRRSGSRSVSTIMAKSKSTSESKLKGTFVDFDVTPRFTIPSMTFLDDESLEIINQDLKRTSSDLPKINNEIAKIGEHLGELPISIESLNSSKFIRIHFPNTDSNHVRNLLRDIEVTRGVIHDAESFSMNNIKPMISSSYSNSFLPLSLQNNSDLSDSLNLAFVGTTDFGSLSSLDTPLGTAVNLNNIESPTVSDILSSPVSSLTGSPFRRGSPRNALGATDPPDYGGNNNVIDFDYESISFNDTYVL